MVGFGIVLMVLFLVLFGWFWFSLINFGMINLFLLCLVENGLVRFSLAWLSLGSFKIVYGSWTYKKERNKERKQVRVRTGVTQPLWASQILKST